MEEKENSSAKTESTSSSAFPEGQDRDRYQLEKKIRETATMTSNGPDLEGDNFWGAGINLMGGRSGPGMSDDDSATSSNVTEREGNMNPAGEKVVSGSGFEVGRSGSMAPPTIVEQEQEQEQEHEQGETKTNEVDKDINPQAPPTVPVETTFTDATLSIVSNIESNDMLNGVVKGEGQGQGEGNLSGRSEASGVSELSQSSAFAASKTRSKSSIGNWKSQKDEQNRLDNEAEHFLPDNDDHSVLSISSTSSQHLHDSHKLCDDEAEGGHALLLKNDEWIVTPHKRAVIAPEASAAVRKPHGSGEVVFGTKLVQEKVEGKVIVQSARATR